MDVVVYRCESWIIKKAEWQRIDAFELWCWRRLLRVPYTARITHQSILKEINIICIFIGRTYAKAPTLWPPDEKIWLIRKCPDAGKDWRQERRGQQRVRWLDGFTNTVDLSLSNFWEMVKDREDWHAAVHGVTKSRTVLSDWTTTKRIMPSRCCIQYVSKSGRPSSGHRTGKGQFSSQFPRKVVPKNVWTIRLLHSYPMLVRSYLKSCMLDFSIMQPKNFQMSKLSLEKEEEPEIKLPKFPGS